MTRESAISRATRHFDDGAFIADLARRIAFRTESQVPESRPHLAEYLAQELRPSFERIGFNAKFLIETGEEIGSPGLQEFCVRERARLKADVLIASDGPRLSAQRPTIYLGSRGALNMEFSVDLRAGAHHSGNWGGLLANPGVILAHALASIVTREGKVLAPGILPERIPDAVRAALADCAVEPGAEEPAIDDWWGEPGFSRAEKVYGWNTFEVTMAASNQRQNAMAMGGASKRKALAMTQLPAQASTARASSR